MSNLEFVGGKEASKILGVHQRTLYQWDEKGEIETLYYFFLRNNIRLL